MRCLTAVAVLAVTATALGAEPYRGPVIDAHNHWTASRTDAAMLRLMQRHGVVATIVMSRGYGNPANAEDLPADDAMTRALAKKHPGAFFALVGMQLPMLTFADWNKPDAALERLYRTTEDKLSSGDFKGIGEVIIRHYAYFNSQVKPGPHMEIRKRPDSRHMHRLAEIAVRHDVPIVVHMEGEPALVAGLDALLARHPALKLVWSHACGRIDAAVIETMLAKHAGLHCDLANMTNVRQGYGYAVGADYPARQGWPRAFAWTFLSEENGAFFPAMRRAIERFPDRFLGVGMDNAHREIGAGIYGARIGRHRQLLGTLAPDVAEKLAFANAVRLFKLSGPGLPPAAPGPRASGSRATRDLL